MSFFYQFFSIFRGFFEDFYWILKKFWKDFSRIFRIFLKNADFAKYSIFLRKNHYFSDKIFSSSLNTCQKNFHVLADIWGIHRFFSTFFFAKSGFKNELLKSAQTPIYTVHIFFVYSHFLDLRNTDFVKILFTP